MTIGLLFCFVVITIGLCFCWLYTNFNLRKVILRKDEQLDSLAERLRSAEKPKKVWCNLHGKTDGYGYAAAVMISHDGFVFPPIDPKERELALVIELIFNDIEVLLGAPIWTPMKSYDTKKLSHVYMLGAVYSVPQQKSESE